MGRQTISVRLKSLRVERAVVVISVFLLAACGAAGKSPALPKSANSEEVSSAAMPGGDDGAERAHGETTRHDRRIVKALIKFAVTRDEESVADVPVARNGLWLGLADQLMVRRSTEELVDARQWRLRSDGFRAYVGLFSALDLLGKEGPNVISIGSHPHCASPPMPAPARVADLRRVSVQPKDTESCLEWFTVDLFLNSGGKIAAVTLDLWEP